MSTTLWTGLLGGIEPERRVAAPKSSTRERQIDLVLEPSFQELGRRPRGDDGGPFGRLDDDEARARPIDAPLGVGPRGEEATDLAKDDPFGQVFRDVYGQVPDVTGEVSAEPPAFVQLRLMEYGPEGRMTVRV